MLIGAYRNYFRIIGGILGGLHHNNEFQKTILYNSSDILIIADFSLPSLRDTSKLLKFCNAKIPFAKTKVIAIKNTSAKEAELTQPQFEDGIKQTIDCVIPFDRNSTLNALNSGKIFADKYPRHPIIKNLKTLLCSITKASILERPTSLLEKLKSWRL